MELRSWSLIVLQRCGRSSMSNDRLYCESGMKRSETASGRNVNHNFLSSANIIL